jgi:hypothetical protein
MKKVKSVATARLKKGLHYWRLIDTSMASQDAFIQHRRSVFYKGPP